MTEPRYSPRGPVWEYTYAQGPEAGTAFVQSPQPRFNKQHGSIVVRQVDAESGHDRAWVNRDPSLLVRRDETLPFSTLADAHGIVLADGFGPAVDPTFGSILAGSEAAPMVAYYRGERVWVEKSLDAIGSDGLIPVVSIDTMEQYKLPFSAVCFVPQLERTDRKSGGKRFAAVVGPYKTTSCLSPPRRARSYFEWSSARPHEARRRWECEDPGEAGPDSAMNADYRPIESSEERRRLFQEQWDIASAAQEPEEEDDSECPHGFILDTSVVGNHYLSTCEVQCAKETQEKMKMPCGLFWPAQECLEKYAPRAVL